MLVKGYCKKEFLAIKEIFEDFFKTDKETGAAFSVIQNKQKIIFYRFLYNCTDC